MTTYRLNEEGQNEERIAEYVAMFTECPEDVPAIVVVGEEWVLDGHHRYLASQIVGVTPRVSHLTQAQYDALVAANVDLIDRAAVAHLLSGNDDAITAMEMQFSGADIYGTASDALALIAA